MPRKWYINKGFFTPRLTIFASYKIYQGSYNSSASSPPILAFTATPITLRRRLHLPRSMDTTDRRYLEEEDSSLTKTMKGAATGLAAGTIWGTVVATWLDVPRVERNVALPGLVRTLKMMGNHVGGFVAGAAILGFKGKSISTALSAGAALAATSTAIDVGGQTTRVDTGKEYYPYTTKKRVDAAN
ncbi:putative mitochondrial import inner membrane translocase subunit TIM22 [Helianthus annuus]|nr:putative mitochondrial import inner membrane translocase subunit TIM22 [Helianthus annuus]